MRKTSVGKRALSIFVSLAMVVSMMPAYAQMAFAEDQPIVQSETQTGTQDNSKLQNGAVETQSDASSSSYDVTNEAQSQTQSQASLEATPQEESEASLAAGNVCKIGTTEYATVQAAVDVVTSEQTIQMIADSQENVTIADDKTVTLDLNGYVLKSANEGEPVVAIGKSENSTAMLTLTDSNPTAIHSDSYASLPAGGVITGATNDEDGGGVRNLGTFTMYGGTITGNATSTGTGGGAYNVGTMTVGGTAVITGNTASTTSGSCANNLYLPDGKIVNIDNGSHVPTVAMNIGVTTQTAPSVGSPVVFTSETINGNETHFFSDSENSAVWFNSESKVLELRIVAASITDESTTKTTKYETVQAALNAAQSGQTVKLIADCTESVKVTSEEQNSDITLDLNGHALKAESDYAITVANVAFSLKDSNADSTHIDYDTLKGGVIAGGSSGLFISSNATVSMYGGTIANSSGTNGGVYMFGGTFNMYDGVICNNTNTGTGGGGVSVDSTSIFNMSGGSITGNSASRNMANFGCGGGVYNKGTFNMSGGKISGNTAKMQGGGVYNKGTFNMSGGEIFGNTAKLGGGAYNNGTMTVGGTSKITGNTKSDGTANNLYLPNSKTIVIGTKTGSVEGNGVSALAEGASIGVTLASVQGQFTSNGAKTDEAFFLSDNSAYADKYNEGTGSGGYLELVEGYVVTCASCTNGTVSTGNQTSAYEGETITVTATPDEGYELDAVRITKTDGGSDVTSEVGYNASAGTFTMPAYAVTVSATFKVSHTHSWTYKVSKSDESLTYNDTIKATCGNAGCTAEDTSLTIQAPESLTYDGNSHDATFGTTTSFCGGSLPTISYEYKAEEGGTYATVADTKPAGFYKASFTVGDKTAYVEYTIEKKILTVTSTTADAKKYDGTTAVTTISLGTLSGEVSGDDVSIASATGAFDTKDAGNGRKVTITYTLGGTAASNYTVSDSTTTADIEKREVTLTSASDSKTYDGSALINSTVTASGDAWANGEGATYTVTGSQTKAGSSDNSFTYTLNENTNPDNYTISTPVYGTLTVSPKQLSISTETGKTTTVSDKVYDGTTTASATCGTLVGKVGTDDVAVEIDSATFDTKDVGENIGVSVVYKISGDDAANYAKPNDLQTSATITKRSITLASESATKVYDGKPLTNNNVTVGGSGWVNDEGATYTFTGTQTLAGSSENSFTYQLNDDTKAGNYDIATPIFGTLTVNAITTPITITAATDTKTYDATALTNNSFTYTENILVDGDTLSATVEGTITNVGSAANKVTSYKVTNAGGTDVTGCYTFGTSVDGTLTIEKRPVSLWSESATKVYDGKALTAETVYANKEKEAVDSVFAAQVDNLKANGSVTDVTDKPVTNAISYSFKSGYSSDNFTVSKTEGTLAVTPADTLTITGATYTGVYDGKAHGEAVTPNITEGTTVSYSTDGGQTWSTEVPYITNVGTVSVTAKAENANYKEASCTYTLSVTKATITVTPTSGVAKTYGEADPELTYEASQPVSSEIACLSGSLAREAGEDVKDGGYVINIGSLALIDSTEDAFKAANYELKLNELPVSFTINKRSVTLTSATDTKTYDGKPLTNNNVTVGGSGWVNDEGATYTFTGTQTLAGSSENSFSYELKSNTKAGNYDIATPIFGTLTVEAIATPITITAATDTKIYDGTALTNNGFTKTENILVNGDTLSATVEGTITNVGSTDNKVTSYKVTNTGGTDVTNCYTFAESNVGKLTINPAPVVVRAKNDTQEYTGSVLTPKTEASVEGRISETDTITYKFSYNEQAKECGDYPITVYGDTLQGNYSVSYISGVFTIKAPGKVTVSFDTDGKGYSIPSQTIVKYEQAVEPDTPTASGYVFEGWYEKGSSTKFDFNTQITKDTTLYAKWTESKVARLESSGKIYNTLASAIEAASAEDTITLLDNVTETPIIFPEGKALTLDLKGKTLSGNIGVQGKLSITDTSSTDLEKAGGVAGSFSVDKDKGASLSLEAGHYTTDIVAYLANTTLTALNSTKEGFSVMVGKKPETQTEATEIMTEAVEITVAETIPEADKKAIEEVMYKATSSGVAEAITEKSVNTIYEKAGITETDRKDDKNTIAIDVTVKVEAAGSNLSDPVKPTITYDLTPEVKVKVYKQDSEGKQELQKEEKVAFTNDYLDQEKPISVSLPVAGSFEVKEVKHIDDNKNVIEVFHKSGSKTFGYNESDKCVSLDIYHFSSAELSGTVDYVNLNYNANYDDSLDEPQTVCLKTADNVFTVQTDTFVREGWTISSWNTLADGKGTAYTPGSEATIPTNDLTLYAQWTQNDYTVSVEQAEHGQVSTSAKTAHFGDTVTLSATAESGYKLKAYVVDGTEQTEASFTMPSHDVTVSALFEADGSGGSTTQKSSSQGSSKTAKTGDNTGLVVGALVVAALCAAGAIAYAHRRNTKR